MLSLRMKLNLDKLMWECQLEFTWLPMVMLTQARWCNPHVKKKNIPVDRTITQKFLSCYVCNKLVINEWLRLKQSTHTLLVFVNCKSELLSWMRNPISYINQQHCTLSFSIKQLQIHYSKFSQFSVNICLLQLGKGINFVRVHFATSTHHRNIIS